MATAALADLVGSAPLTAVTVTVDGDGTDDGALYVPRLLMVPTVEFPPVTPFTFQLTDVFVAFCTVAVKARVRLTRTVALVGEIVTLTGTPGVTVTVAVPETVGRVVLVAVIVTALDGTFDGAV